MPICSGPGLPIRSGPTLLGLKGSCVRVVVSLRWLVSGDADRVSSRLSSWCVGVRDEVGDGDWFVAVGAVSAVVDAACWGGAVWAPLFADVAVVAGGALIDRDVFAAPWCGDRVGGVWWGCVGAGPRGFAAVGRAESLTSDAGEHGAADRAVELVGCRRDVVA